MSDSLQEPRKDLRFDSATLSETLDQLLASKTFSRSGQLKRLLVYLRNASGSEDAAVLSETAIGATAFGRKDFNPKIFRAQSGAISIAARIATRWKGRASVGSRGACFSSERNSNTMAERSSLGRMVWKSASTPLASSGGLRTPNNLAAIAPSA